MRVSAGPVFGCIICLAGLPAFAQTTETAGVPTPQQTAPTPPPELQNEGLARFLTRAPKPAGPEADTPYADVPPSLDAAVRMVAMDNFSSATAELQKSLSAAKDDREKTYINMWLGIAYGSQAINYPSTGWEHGTSATAHLKQAIALDAQVILAPDVARIMAEMVAHGWASEDPATALQRAEQKAEETRRAIDFYFAGIISKRLSARAWGYSDTTEQDQKTLALFAKSIAREPARYETWSAYLPALLPAGMHDLATSEAQAMYRHFGNLRTPLLAEQGPAVLMLSVSSYRTTEKDRVILDEVAAKWPEAPMPPFELAMRAIETSPSEALELFPQFIQRMKSGDLKPLPREAGYYPSALYKYGFLLQSMGELDKAIDVYKQVRDLSPGYAELNLNLAILLAQKSDKETTGPLKLQLLQDALPYAEAQEKLDYRGRAALKAGEMRQRLRSIIYRMKQELKTTGTATAP